MLQTWALQKVKSHCLSSWCRLSLACQNGWAHGCFTRLPASSWLTTKPRIKMLSIMVVMGSYLLVANFLNPSSCVSFTNLHYREMAKKFVLDYLRLPPQPRTISVVWPSISDSRCKHRVITNFKCYIHVITDFTPHCRFFALYPIKFTAGRSGLIKSQCLSEIMTLWQNHPK